MLGEYPPASPSYCAICSLFWICNLFPYGQILINKNQQKTPATCQMRATGDLVHRAEDGRRWRRQNTGRENETVFSFQVKLSYGTNAGRKLCILLPQVFFWGNETSQSFVLSVYKTAEEFFPWKCLGKLELPWDLLYVYSQILHVCLQYSLKL